MNSTLWIQDSTYSRLPIIPTIKGNKKFELSRAKLYRKRSRGFELSVLSVERGLEIPTVSGFRITKPHFLT